MIVQRKQLMRLGEKDAEHTQCTESGFIGALQNPRSHTQRWGTFIWAQEKAANRLERGIQEARQRPIRVVYAQKLNSAKEI